MGKNKKKGNTQTVIQTQNPQQTQTQLIQPQTQITAIIDIDKDLYIKFLTDENKNLKIQLKEYETTNACLMLQISGQYTTIKELENENKLLREQIEELKTKCDELNTKCNSLEKKYNALEQSQLMSNLKYNALEQSQLMSNLKYNALEQSQLMSNLLVAIQDLNSEDLIETKTMDNDFLKKMKIIRENRNSTCHFINKKDTREEKQMKKYAIKVILNKLTPKQIQHFEIINDADDIIDNLKKYLKNISKVKIIDPKSQLKTITTTTHFFSQLDVDELL
jgi:hypothetical protein